MKYARKQIGLSIEECVILLAEHRKRIEDLMALLDGRTSQVSREDKALAQSQLSVIKDRLRSDYQSREAKIGRAAMSVVERANVLPAVHQAFCELSVKSNSNPDGKWLTELYAALIDINFYLRPLEDRISGGER